MSDVFIYILDLAAVSLYVHTLKVIFIDKILKKNVLENSLVKKITTIFRIVKKNTNSLCDNPKSTGAKRHVSIDKHKYVSIGIDRTVKSVKLISLTLF